MKRIILTLICLLIVNILLSQVPHKFNYQAVLRSSGGQALSNKSVKVRISFLNGSETGNSLYTEEHSVVTNSQGVFNVEAGGSSNVILGSFASIDWSTSSIWLKVEVDENLTGSFTSLGAKQLLSVPFALYAESGNQGPKGDTGNGISGIVDNGNGTLTINYTNGGSYLTPNLKGPQGEKGEQGSPGTGLANKGNWISGTIYNPGDYVFASNTQQTGNAMWIVKASASFTSNTEPRLDLTNWIEFQAPQGPPGPLVSGTSGQTLRNNGTTWIANDNIFNDGTNVGIGIALPTQKLDVNGALRLRGNIFDYDNLSGTNGQLLYKTTNGIKWLSPTYANIGTNGTAGQLALWSNSTSLQGLTNLTWGTSLQVQSITTADPDAPILEVKNSAGQVVFGVYQGGVRIYVDDSAVKGARGGFAVGGLSQTKAGTSTEYFRITPDSARIYFNNSTVKGARGGFAVGGLSQTKATTSSEYLRITRDSARIYVNNSPNKGARGGFAVGGLSQTKTSADNFMQLTPDNYFIGHQSGSKTIGGLYNNFLGYQAGLSNTSGNSNAFIGYKAGYSNTSGASNVFVGNQSGYTNSTGEYNTFLGYNAGYTNNSSYNTFIGYQSGKANTSGQYNSFMGYNAGLANTTGNKNLFLGFQSGSTNTTGTSNVYIGTNAGFKNNGFANVAIGDSTASQMTSGNYNIVIGRKAGISLSSGSWNVLIGESAGYSGASANYNVMIGQSAGFNTTSSFNTYLGINAGYKISSGNNNVFLGTNAGAMLESGSANTIVGIDAGRSGNWDPGIYHGYSTSNNTLIGTGAGYSFDSGDRNTFIGSLSGNTLATGSGNVFIGYKAGSGIDGLSDQLFIANDYGTPLIYGNFLSKYVGLGTTTPLTNLHINSTALNQYGHLLVNRSVSGGLGGTVVIRNASTGIVGNAAALGFEIDGSTAFETNGNNANNAEIRATIEGTNGSTKLQISNWNGNTGSENTGIVLSSSGDVTLGNSLNVSNTVNTSYLNVTNYANITGDIVTNGTIETSHLWVNENATVQGTITGNVTGNLTGNVNGIAMGKLLLNGSGTLLNACNGKFVITSNGSTITITNNSGTYCHVWWQGQQASVVSGSITMINTVGSTQALPAFTANGQGMEIHIGLEDGSAYCSMWVGWSNSKLFGHYTMY